LLLLLYFLFEIQTEGLDIDGAVRSRIMEAIALDKLLGDEAAS
jgi:hypothetical protein|tara:strand:- start:123 stop:251 length:129 start_codon:yes stop_codon:yes gene_type:complete